MNVKQVIVIRRDLKMRRGKEIAQGSHASMAFLTKKLESQKNVVELDLPTLLWLRDGFTKVCVRVDSEEQLLDIAKKANDAGIKCKVITDSGKTEFDGVPTRTCLALGPDYSEKIDNITGDLQLY